MKYLAGIERPALCKDGRLSIREPAQGWAALVRHHRAGPRNASVLFVGVEFAKDVAVNEAEKDRPYRCVGSLEN